MAAALGGLVAATPLVGAENPAPDPTSHLLVVPNDADGVRALAESDVRTVARYGDFTLVEARGSDEEDLRGAGAKRRDDMRHVRLGGKLLDPANRRTLASKSPRRGEEELVLVQFAGPVKDAWFQRLNGTGGQVVGYVAQNGYIVHATGEAIDRLADLVGTHVEVRAVTPLEAADKYEGAAPPSGDVTIQTVAGAAGADARAATGAAGRRLRDPSTVRGVVTQYLHLAASDVAALADDPAVVTIGRYAAPVLHDERASQIAAGNLSAGIPTAPTYLQWLTSEGFGAGTFDFVVDMADTGLDDGSTAPAHPDFYVNGTKAQGSRVAYVRDWSPDGDASADGPATTPPRDKANDDCWGHGTNVASILTGFNAAGGSSNGTNDSAGFNYGLGVAPRAKIGSSKLFGCTGGFAPTSLTAIAATAHRSGARISNNSWGLDQSGGDYSPEAQELDALVRDADPLRPDDPATGANEFDPGTPGNQQLVEVVSAGNEGGAGYTSVSAPGTAKNVITVGASENVRPGFTDGCGYASSAADNGDHLAAFSGRGPTDDLRLKPDLVAPGTHVVGARPSHDAYFNGTTLTPAMICNPIFPSGTLYSLVTGTSQAAPVVSGAAALVRDWYAREHGSGSPPSPALTKAILIDGATDLAGAVDGKGGTLPPAPSMEAGWGRPDLSRAFGSTQREYLDQTELITNSGQSDFHSYAVASPSAPVRVTLAWTDAVPAATGGDAFVNDLDLTVDAGGRTYRGNVMDGGVSIPGGAADQRNNLESVVLPAGLAGRISVEVGGTSIGGDGVPGNGDPTDQDFALVVSNADEVGAPVLSTQSVSVSDGGSGGDNDSVLESGEEVDLTPVVRNSGTVTAVEVSGAAGDGDGLSFDPPGSSGFPDIDPDSAEAAVNNYGATYSAAAPCGSDATGTLTMTASGEQQELPIVVPTGELGATLTSSAAGPEVPKAIPDNNTIGVASTLSVTTRGRIRDLNVRIGGITHPWVGDLAISLTGPDGTTVTLARHPGGPDNGSDNLTNVTFDDEAGGTIPSTGPVAGGTYRPQGDQLSRFDGKDRRGTWTLRVRDLLTGSTGTLTAWSAISRRALCDFDVAAPALERTAFPGSPDDASATFAFESPDPDARFECRLDGGAYAECASPQVLNGLPDGQHSFSIQAIDGSGNESAEIPHVWEVDTVPPETMIGSAPAAFVSSDDPSFSFSSDSAVLRFECALDGEAFSECTSAASYSDIGEGPHTFRVRAEDLAGNVDPTPATHSFTVDTVGPQPQVTGPVSPTKDRTPILRGTVAQQAGDTLAVTVELFAGADDSGSPVQTHNVTGNGQGNWAVQVSPALALGQYTVRARQVDQAGNPGQQTRTFTVVDDDDAPVVDLRAPGPGSITGDSTPRVAGVAGTSDGDEPTVVVRLYRGSLVGGLPAHSLVVPVAAASGAFAVDTPRLADGQWTAVVGQLDSAGNAGSSAPAGFTVASGPAPPPPVAGGPGLIAVSGIEELRAVRRGGLPVLLSCGAACSARASLTISASGARRVGLSSVLIGRSSTRLAGAGQKRMSVRLRPAVRRALASASGARMRLRVRLAQGDEHASLSGSVSLRNGRLERVVRRGYALFVASSETSRVAGSLREGGRTIASGVRSGVRSTKNLVLSVPRAQRSRLLRRERLRAALVLTARGDDGAESAVSSTLRLRR